MKVVVTGMGMVTSLGEDVKSTWDGLINSKSGVTEISRFDASGLDTKIAAEVDDVFEDKAKKIISRRMRKQMTRTTRMAMVAAEEAIEDSGINDFEIDPFRIATIMGVIDTTYADAEIKEVDMNMVVKKMPNAPSANISIKNGYKGVNFNVSAACASSAYAVAIGTQFIKAGIYDAVIVGGTDSTITKAGVDGFNRIMALSVNNEDPKSASCPFSKNRDGFVIGEGAGVMVIESEKLAKKRGVKVYGEILGYSFTSEAYNITAPEDDGKGMADTMRRAIENAGIKIEDVDYINAHGTSTLLNDKFEAMAIKNVFKDKAKELRVSSIKSMIGHTLGAAGAIECISTLLTIKSGIIPPTINFDESDIANDLNYVPNVAEIKAVDIALSNSFGFGGHNATLVIGKIGREK